MNPILKIPFCLRLLTALSFTTWPHCSHKWSHQAQRDERSTTPQMKTDMKGLYPIIQYPPDFPVVLMMVKRWRPCLFVCLLLRSLCCQGLMSFTVVKRKQGCGKKYVNGLCTVSEMSWWNVRQTLNGTTLHPNYSICLVFNIQHLICSICVMLI